jgi:tRNA (guanine-N(7)-)-methyltransferase subunit TRM82
MPKRPVSVVVGPDAQIICADKFGDVYAIPLLYNASTAVLPQSSSASASPAPSSIPKAPKKVAASALTVHSQRNLRALEQQQRLESENAHVAAAGGEKGRADVPEFEHVLLLGHVSMLTSLALGERDGRRYIITSDRDEHIRVSRYIPQAHVIEGFCLGHRDFISSMEIPCTRSDVLVSGGGDDEVLVWDWQAGELLSRTNLLKLVREIVPEISKVALSHLSSLAYPSAAGDLIYILAICEE